MIIQELEKVYPVSKMADYLGVSRQGYWRWKRRQPTRIEMEDEVLKALILKEFDDNKKRYGYRRVAQSLAKKGVKVCKHRVARLMNEMSLKARACKKFKVTTDSHHKKPIADDLINQNFAADRPDEKYVSDITYVRTREGWLYLCIVLDLFSKMVIGWSFSRRMKAALVVNAINMAAGKGRSLKGCIFHSDRGSQYCSKEVIKALQHYGMRQSMGRTGCCYDNAAAESFFHTLKVEGTFGKPFKSISEASLYIFEFIEVFYNRNRMHSGLNYFSPAEFEQLSVNEEVRNCA
jgi:transposase InsO family protein